MSTLIKLIGTSLFSAALLSSAPTFADSHKMDPKAHKMPMGEMNKEAVSAKGVVKEILADANKVKVHHQPIQAWKMGAMQMTFELGPEVDISKLKAGQTIHFMTKSPSTGKFIITRLLGH